MCPQPESPNASNSADARTAPDMAKTLAMATHIAKRRIIGFPSEGTFAKFRSSKFRSEGTSSRNFFLRSTTTHAHPPRQVDPDGS
jgi:hypothetical protein